MTTLDERTGALLERICALCEGGGYRLLEEAELSPCAPEALAEAFACLSDLRLAEVRYAGEVYCVRVLPAGRAYAAAARERALERRKCARRTALAAFSGALAGGLLCLMALLFVLIARG